MKKLFLSMTLMLVVLLAACTAGSTETLSADRFVSIDINPSVEFTLDEEDIVVTVDYLNEDAEIVGAELELVGLPFSEALELYLNAAIEAGYLDVTQEENVIVITSDDEEKEQGIIEDVEDLLTRRGIGAAIFGGEISEEHRALAEEYGIGAGRVRLIARAVEIDGELTFEEALELEHSEIMSILVEAHQAHMQAFREARQTRAREMREHMQAIAQEHRQAGQDAIEEGEVPDFDAIREQARERMEALREEHQQRMREAREEAQERRGSSNRP